MAVQVRKLAISYGGFSLGGSTGIHPHKFHGLDIGSETSTVSFDVKVLGEPGDSDTDFAGKIQSMEASFRKPRQDLVISCNGVTWLSLSHTSSTGFDADPHIVKAGQDGDSARSRVYTIRISFGMPADNVGTAGRRKSATALQFDASGIATVTISGTYTAIGSTNARDTYDAGIGPFATVQLGRFGIVNSDLVTEVATENETIKTLDFTRTYVEVIYDEGPGGTSAAIKKQVLRITLGLEMPGDSPDPPAVRFSVARAHYEANIDKRVTQDLKGQWASLLPWVIDQAKAVLDGSVVYVKSRQVDYDLTGNRIVADLILEGATTGTVIENNVLTEDNLNEGRTLVPVWNGDRFAAFLFQGPAVLTRTKTEQRVVIDSSSLDGGGSSRGGLTGTPRGGAAPAGSGASAEDFDIVPAGPSFVNLEQPGGQWVRTSKRAGERPKRMGIPPDTLLTLEQNTVTTWQYFHEVANIEREGLPVGSSGS